LIAKGNAFPAGRPGLDARGRRRIRAGRQHGDVKRRLAFDREANITFANERLKSLKLGRGQNLLYDLAYEFDSRRPHVG
jgi:hypothetical protein